MYRNSQDKPGKLYPYDPYAASNVARAVDPLLWQDDRVSAYDPLGSYTGSPADPEEHPVQDADDL